MHLIPMKLVIFTIQTIFYFCGIKKLLSIKLGWIMILFISYLHANSPCQTEDSENRYGLYIKSWGDAWTS